MKSLKTFAVSFIIILTALPLPSFAQASREFSFPQTTRRNVRTRSLPFKVIQLTEPNLAGNISLEKALAERRSVREFSKKKLTYTQIGQLAWAGQGITDTNRGFRTAPSVGAIYPLILYIATDEGIFTYNPREHALQQFVQGSISNQLAEAAFGQNAIADAPCNIIIAGSVRKLVMKYQNAARRYMLLEAGHVAQNILLESVSLDLGAVPIGVFNLDAVRQICRMQRDVEPLYIIPVGHPAEKSATPKQKAKRTSPGKAPFSLKTVVLIVASKNFNEMELLQTQKAIVDTGINTIIASSKIGVIMGMSGRRTYANMSIDKINVDDFKAIVFIGGPGAQEYLFNPIAERIIKQADEKNIIIGAISVAPALLAKAGILNGRNVTAAPSQKSFLETAGAKFTGTFIEKDGNIITAARSQDAVSFGKTIATAVKPPSQNTNPLMQSQQQQMNQQQKINQQLFNP